LLGAAISPTSAIRVVFLRFFTA